MIAALITAFALFENELKSLQEMSNARKGRPSLRDLINMIQYGIGERDWEPLQKVISSRNNLVHGIRTRLSMKAAQSAVDLLSRITSSIRQDRA